jgi:hypothetical protein
VAASGGADRQTVASAKLLAPESLRTVTRTVTREDFEINARRVSGVARALMLTSNEDLSRRAAATFRQCGEFASPRKPSAAPRTASAPRPASIDEVDGGDELVALRHLPSRSAARHVCPLICSLPTHL